MLELLLSKIRTDGGTQSRAAIDPAVVDEYAIDYVAGAPFPEPIVFHDGESYWLADGFHRIAACKKIGKKHIAVAVKQGTQEDAIWFSCSANSAHGLKRTNADKQRAGEVALQHPKSKDMSAREIAEHCGVGHKMVGARMEELESGGALLHLPEKRKGKDGKFYPAKRLPAEPASGSSSAPTLPVEIKPAPAEEAAVKPRTRAAEPEPEPAEPDPAPSLAITLSPAADAPAPAENLTAAARDAFRAELAAFLFKLDRMWLRMDDAERARTLAFVHRFVARHEKEIKSHVA